MILKSVIHFPDTNSVEATWAEIVTPEITVPESQAPDTTDADGNVIPGEITPAHTTPAVERQIKCHSYADVQMQMFRDDAAQMGTPLTDYETLIAEVEAAIVPYVAPPLTATDIVTAMEQLFDATAQSKHYDNRITCALRAGYFGPFQQEGIAFATWMDSQNAKGYTMLAQVQAGTMPMPATVADALALLDPMVWPA